MIESLITLVEAKIKKHLGSDVNTIDESMFNLVDYENNDPLNLNDHNECVNRNKLNILCAYFVLNESDINFNKRLCEMGKQIVFKWPNQV